MRRRARYTLGVDMGLGMTILMVAMMVLMVGAILWGALAARGSRQLSAVSPKGGWHRRVDDRHATGRPPAREQRGERHGSGAGGAGGASP